VHSPEDDRPPQQDVAAPGGGGSPAHNRPELLLKLSPEETVDEEVERGVGGDEEVADV